MVAFRVPQSAVDSCRCRTSCCPIIFTVFGVMFVVGGIVIAAIGFGRNPLDMYDTGCMTMRILGLVLVGSGILPCALAAMFWSFFVANRKGRALPGMKSCEKPGIIYTSTAEKVAMNEYPYPPEPGNIRPIYNTPGQMQMDDSDVFRDDEDSFASGPINMASKSSSERPRYPPQYRDVPENEGWPRLSSTGVNQEIPQMKKSFDEPDSSDQSKNTTKKEAKPPKNHVTYEDEEEPLPGQSSRSPNSSDSFAYGKPQTKPQRPEIGS